MMRCSWYQKDLTPATGEAMEDNVQEVSISSLEMEIKSLKERKDLEAARMMMKLLILKH